MATALRRVGFVLYLVLVVLVAVVGVMALTGSLDAYALRSPFLENPPCAEGRIDVDPYFHDQPATAGCISPPLQEPDLPARWRHI